MIDIIHTIRTWAVTAAEFLWANRWWIPVLVLVLGAVSVALTAANNKDRRVRDLWRSK